MRWDIFVMDIMLLFIFYLGMVGFDFNLRNVNCIKEVVVYCMYCW